MKLREKTTATLLIALFMISTFAIVIPVIANPPITIDGILSSGEWDNYFWFRDNSEGPYTGPRNDDPFPIFTGYLTLDAENLYLAFNVEDDTPLALGMSLDRFYVLIDVPPVDVFDVLDPLVWVSMPTNPSLFMECYETTTPSPNERNARYSTWGVDVETARTITDTNRYYELKIPLSAIGASIGDTIGLKVLAEDGDWPGQDDDWPGWYYSNYYPDLPSGIADNVWNPMFHLEVEGNFEHVTLVLPPPTKADILQDKGVPGEGIDDAPGLDKLPPNDNFGGRNGPHHGHGPGPENGIPNGNGE